MHFETIIKNKLSMDPEEISADNIAVGFRNLTVATHSPPHPLLYRVNGFVARGCITAGYVNLSKFIFLII